MSEWFDYSHYHIDSKPHTCKYCEGIYFKSKVKGYEAGSVSEYEVYCSSCDNLVGYWAYGHFDPCFANLHPTEGP